MRRFGILCALAACGPGDRADDHLDARPTGDPPGSVPQSRVYAHSGNMLYQIDTQTLAPVQIGAMTGLGAQSLTDLAIDNSDRMIGITLERLVAIDPATGTTTMISDLPASARGFTSLS